MTIYSITKLDYEGRVIHRFTTIDYNKAVDFVVNHCRSMGDFYRYYDDEFLYCIDGVPNSSEGSIDVELGDLVVAADEIVSKLLKDVEDAISSKNDMYNRLKLKRESVAKKRLMRGKNKSH